MPSAASSAAVYPPVRKKGAGAPALTWPRGTLSRLPRRDEVDVAKCRYGTEMRPRRTSRVGGARETMRRC